MTIYHLRMLIKQTLIAFTIASKRESLNTIVDHTGKYAPLLRSIEAKYVKLFGPKYGKWLYRFVLHSYTDQH
jgi:hypothetical protein